MSEKRPKEEGRIAPVEMSSWGSAAQIDFVVELVMRVHHYARHDPKVALQEARQAAEAICKTVFAREIGEPGNIQLNDLLATLAKKSLLPLRIQVPFGTIQAYGNLGSHAQPGLRDVDAEYIATPLSALSEVVSWYFEEYLKAPMPAELARLLATRPQAHAQAPSGSSAASSGAIQPVSSTAAAQARGAAAVSRPRRLLVGAQRCYLGTDGGEWLGWEATGEALPPIPPLAAISAAILDGKGQLAVASYDRAVARLRQQSWDVVHHEAAVLALAACAGGLAIGDSDGRVTVLGDSTSAPRVIPVGRSSATSSASGAGPVPVIDLLEVDGRLAALTTEGAALVARSGQGCDRVDVAAVGAPDHLFAAHGRLGVASAERVGLVDLATGRLVIVSDPIADGVRAVIALGRPDRLALLSDAGEVWLLDERLRATRLRLPPGIDAAIGLCASPARGELVVWTQAGALLRVAPDHSVRRVTDEGVALAGAVDNQLWIVRWARDGGAIDLERRLVGE